MYFTRFEQNKPVSEDNLIRLLKYNRKDFGEKKKTNLTVLSTLAVGDNIQ